jgi:hypothetical protein
VAGIDFPNEIPLTMYLICGEPDFPIKRGGCHLAIFNPSKIFNNIQLLNY